MARTKNFPKRIELGMTADSRLVIMPAEVSWKFFVENGIRKVEQYQIIGCEVAKKKAVQKTEQEKVPDIKPIPEKALPQDNVQFKCVKGHAFDEPKQLVSGQAVCPKCGTGAFESVAAEE